MSADPTSVGSDTSEQRLAAIEATLASLSSALSTAIIPKDPSDTVAQAAPATFADMVAKNIQTNSRVIYAPSNEKDDDMRRCLVVKGLPEQGNDKQEILELFKKLDPSADIERCFRMGTVTVSNNKDASQPNPKENPRLLKVRLPSACVAKSILNQASALKICQV